MTDTHVTGGDEDRSERASASLRELLLCRLADSGLPPEAQELARGWLPLAPEAKSEGGAGPVFLRSISATAWRGIGPAATLELRPEPGLTLIAGRNGSGKSSFAEAAEMALTGDNRRWQGRTKVWTEGWRNLHDRSSPEVSVALSLDDGGIPATARRAWHGERLEDARTVVERSDACGAELHDLLDTEKLALYRPFLPYSELGAMINGSQAVLHDALAQILGLEELADTVKVAKAHAKQLADTVTAAADLTSAVTAELGELDDPRAARAVAAMSAREPDLDGVRALLGDHRTADDNALARLRRLAGLTAPDREAVRVAITRLRDAAAAAEDARSGAAEDARQLIGLLERALEHRRRHPESTDCPVCGVVNRLDEAWAEHAWAQIARLQREATEAQDARVGLAAAVRAVQDLVQPVPVHLQADEPALASVWRDWAACRVVTEPRELADLAESAEAVLGDACHQVRGDATKQLSAQDARWQVMAGRLTQWLRQAEAAASAKPRVKQAKAICAWLRKMTDELHDVRLKPLADQSQAVWRLLCERSNVALGPISLTGAASARKVRLDVSVDAKETSAFSVMSQGELHSLALSLFIPRATHPDSPFKFLVIDDPVQSMDPEKVDGLARVLDLYARDRQVIVFTHDTRLQQAIRHLRIPATVMEVSRQTDSVVAVVTGDDPVTRALEETRAVAKDRNLPQEVAERVLPAMCRGVLETAYTDAARRRLRQDGHGRLAAEEAIGKAHRLTELIALALSDRRMQPAEVLEAVGREHGPWARKLIQQCNTGAHEALSPLVDSRDLVMRTERLAEAVLAR
ncbi:AAA family ATPase [Streptomyces sp. IBSNAI001]|uniref:AAA family ATPase n=1 Tax=Streptomyces sp. IBSNAI001 TaxID=3457499 RepID=UPI003FD03AD6